MTLFKTLATSADSGSLANRLRRKRFQLFRALVSRLPRPLKILDVGGTEAFWKQMGFSEELGVTIVTLNIAAVPVTARDFTGGFGDGRPESAFGRPALGRVVSESLSEHVGSIGSPAPTCTQ